MTGPRAGTPHEELLEQELARERRARKQAESLLEQKSLELYARNEELQRAAAALTRSNQELEQFAYAASHDLQAPLRSITGFSQLLRKHAGAALDDVAREYLSFMESSARHLHLLINDLLEYSRVGRVEPRLEWIEPDAVVRQACVQLESQILDRRAQVVCEPLPRVHADAKLLVQLFQNLIGNAIKYAREDRPPEVRIRGAAQDGGWAFAVQDNGIGMEPGETERIFMIFQRLHTADRYEGTGIGLTICKKIVERHGGRIWAESTPGQGSTFRFTLAGAAGDAGTASAVRAA